MGKILVSWDAGILGCWDIRNVISVDEKTVGVTQTLSLHVALDAKCATARFCLDAKRAEKRPMGHL